MELREGNLTGVWGARGRLGGPETWRKSRRSKQEGGASRMTAVPVSTSTGQGHWGTAVSVLDVTGGNATAGSRGQA